MDKQIESLNSKIGVILNYLSLPDGKKPLSELDTDQKLENITHNIVKVGPMLEKEIS